MTHFTTHSPKSADVMHVTRNDRVDTWELNRPEQDNGLGIDTLQAMESSLTELERNVKRLVCLLVLGKPAVFSTGLDGELLKTCFNAVIDRLVSG